MDSSNQITPNYQKVFGIVGTVLGKIGSLIATFFFVLVITGCFVAMVLTVFVLQSMDAEKPVSLASVEHGYTSVLYAYDKDENPVELRKLYIPNHNRVPAAYDDISEYVKQAVVAIEDKRFWNHQGIDLIRTGGAFLNMLSGGNDEAGGGSTIHQQLVKNITGDNAIRVDRKVREIYRAIKLNNEYQKDTVLEAYLNTVSFGAGTSGIEAAANVYFDKSAKDLTLPESAAIVGITKFPTAYNPFFYPEKNKKRQGDVLQAMFDQGMITQEEYDAAWDAPLNFKSAEKTVSVLDPTSYFDDHVIENVITDFMTQKNMTRSEAVNELYMGGYHIYSTVDLEIQEHLETLYLSSENFPSIARDEYPESAAVVMLHNGELKGIIGKIGPKTESLSFNRATMAKRQPGSTLKPIGPYALAFEYNIVRPSTLITDSPVILEPTPWPKNYYGTYYSHPLTVEFAIQQSVNTIAVKVSELVTPATLFDFYYYDLNMTSLVDPTDIAIAPMALGAVTDGVTPLELTGAYQIIANGGNFTKPYAYSKVLDSGGAIALQPDTNARRVLSEDTAVLLNKMVQKVVSSGTGASARIEGVPTAGKTGTSDQDVDQWFIGFTPYYIAGVWLGYDHPNTYDRNGNWVKNSVLYTGRPYPTPILFKSVMKPIHEIKGLEGGEFMTSDGVVNLAYCTITGNLASNACPTASTWFKSSNLPPQCSGVHASVSDTVVGDGNSGESDGGDTSGSSPSSIGSAASLPGPSGQQGDVSVYTSPE